MARTPTEIVRPGKEAAEASPPRISDLTDLPSRPDLVIDCGGHQALAAHGPVALALGIAVIALTGHVQAAGLHDAAHDVRHATGFPCH